MHTHIGAHVKMPICQYRLLLLDGSDDKLDEGCPGGGGDIGTRIGVVNCSEASNVGKSEIILGKLLYIK